MASKKLLFFYAMFYIKLWNSNYKADTICRFISINMLLISWLPPGVKAILTNFTSSAACVYLVFLSNITDSGLLLNNLKYTLMP